MKKRTKGFVVALGVWSAVFAVAPGARAGQELTVNELVSLVNREIEVARAVVLGEPKLELESIVITVKTESSHEVEGKAGLSVPLLTGATPEAGGGAGKERSRAKEVSFKLKPATQTVFQSSPPSIDDFPIARTIVEARKELKSVLGADPPLTPEAMNVTVSFGAKRKAEGSVGISLVVIDLKAAAKYAASTVHRVELSFVRPKLPR